jgi:hypothetical protein
MGARERAKSIHNPIEIALALAFRGMFDCERYLNVRKPAPDRAKARSPMANGLPL